MGKLLVPLEVVIPKGSLGGAMVSKDLVPASFLKPFSQFPSSDSTSLGASLNNFSSSSLGPLWEANPTSDEGKEPLCLLWLGWCSIVMDEKDSL